MTPVKLIELLENIEREHLASALLAAGQNRLEAARLVNLRRTTFIMKCKRYGLLNVPSPHDRRKATHCKAGHELTEKNVYWQSDEGERRYRRCRICLRAKARGIYARSRLPGRVRPRAKPTPMVPV